MPAVALAAVGLGVSAFGAMQQYEGAKDQAEAQKRATEIEMRQEALRQKAMELNAQRQRMEIVRNQQRVRSVALSRANAQGAQFGSGLAGGYGQIAGQSGFNLLGVNQNLEMGQNMFNLNQQLGQQKIAMAAAGTQIAMGQGLSSLGSKLMGASGGFGQLAGNFNTGSAFFPSASFMDHGFGFGG